MCARSAQEMEDWIITMELVLKCEGVCVWGGGGGECFFEAYVHFPV